MDHQKLAAKVADGLRANGYEIVYRDGEREPVDRDAVIECIGTDLYGPLANSQPPIVVDPVKGAK